MNSWILILTLISYPSLDGPVAIESIPNLASKEICERVGNDWASSVARVHIEGIQPPARSVATVTKVATFSCTNTASKSGEDGYPLDSYDILINPDGSFSRIKKQENTDGR